MFGNLSVYSHISQFRPNALTDLIKFEIKVVGCICMRKDFVQFFVCCWQQSILLEKLVWMVLWKRLIVGKVVVQKLGALDRIRTREPNSSQRSRKFRFKMVAEYLKMWLHFGWSNRPSILNPSKEKDYSIQNCIYEAIDICSYTVYSCSLLEQQVPWAPPACPVVTQSRLW